MVAVAANVSYVIEDLIKEFKKISPNTKIKVVLGSSGKLTSQIKNGAPYHLFLSANMQFPQALYDGKVAITKPVVYASGTIAIFSSKKIDFSKGIGTILQDNIKTIVVANPKTAPYGEATIEALKNAKLYEQTKSKFIFAESIGQAISYAVTASDVGFVAKSSLYSDKLSKYKEGVNYIEVDKALYSAIRQGIILTTFAKESNEAKEFYDFILSNQAKEIFKKHGYLVDESN